MFPIVYRALFVVSEQEENFVKTFDTLIPVLDDPRAINIVDFNKKQR